MLMAGVGGSKHRLKRPWVGLVLSNTPLLLLSSNWDLSCYCTSPSLAMSCTITATTSTGTAVEDEYTLLLRSKLGDEPAMDRMSTSFESVFQRVDVKSQTFRDIHQLSQAVNDIDMDFQKIRSDLWRFDQQGFRDQNDQVFQLTPRWIGYHDVRLLYSMASPTKTLRDVAAFQTDHGAQL